MIDEIDANYWDDKIFFWEKIKGNDNITEPDVRMDLSREARNLSLVGADKKKLLLLLADDLVCTEIIQGIKIIDGMQLRYLSLQEIVIQLKELTELNSFEQLAIADII